MDRAPGLSVRLKLTLRLFHTARLSTGAVACEMVDCACPRPRYGEPDAAPS
ncbi:hypothetical protein SAMN05421810_11220 [Amycolatopsis arida]|uniref:Uncharacterized protein n=1 Tax=Amycolatopsis arida TaxID=587909 RepID=A0A1I6AD59_9PSEU|nr:hypothetical protein CLV69_102746 [Amycolatopsis arida]SFQ66609.1 hypothetical protein SAMN05421810_11220 [Amycolatopsis arida]